MNPTVHQDGHTADQGARTVTRSCVARMHCCDSVWISAIALSRCPRAGLQRQLQCIRFNTVAGFRDSEKPNLPSDGKLGNTVRISRPVDGALKFADTTGAGAPRAERTSPSRGSPKCSPRFPFFVIPGRNRVRIFCFGSRVKGKKPLIKNPFGKQVL